MPWACDAVRKLRKVVLMWGRTVCLVRIWEHADSPLRHELYNTVLLGSTTAGEEHHWLRETLLFWSWWPLLYRRYRTPVLWCVVIHYQLEFVWCFPKSCYRRRKYRHEMKYIPYFQPHKTYFSPPNKCSQKLPHVFTQEGQRVLNPQEYLAYSRLSFIHCGVLWGCKYRTRITERFKT